MRNKLRLFSLVAMCRPPKCHLKDQSPSTAATSWGSDQRPAANHICWKRFSQRRKTQMVPSFPHPPSKYQKMFRWVKEGALECRREMNGNVKFHRQRPLQGISDHQKSSTHSLISVSSNNRIVKKMQGAQKRTVDYFDRWGPIWG